MFPPIDKLTPPSDNLYKFWAIFGLVGTLFVVVTPIYEIGRHSDALARVSIDVAKESAEVRAMAAQREIYQVQLEHFKGTNATNEPDELIKAQADFKNLSDRCASAAEELQEASKEASKESAATQIVTYLTGWWIFSTIVFAAITISGFLSWYAFFQRHQDELLKIQVAVAQKQLAAMELQEQESPSTIEGMPRQSSKVTESTEAEENSAKDDEANAEDET